MNKNISLYIYSIAIFATVCLKKLTLAVPANSQLVTSNLRERENIEITIDTTNRKSKDNLTKIVFMASLVGVGAVCWKISQSRRGTKANFKPTKIHSSSNTALLDRVSPKLRRQLLRLINDPKTANRLLMGIYKNNSHRSPNWIAEKAIYDLRRGR